MPAADLTAVHVGQAHVEQDGVEVGAFHGLQRSAPAIRLGDLELLEEAQLFVERRRSSLSSSTIKIFLLVCLTIGFGSYVAPNGPSRPSPTGIVFHDDRCAIQQLL